MDLVTHDTSALLLLEPQVITADPIFFDVTFDIWYDKWYMIPRMVHFQPKNFDFCQWTKIIIIFCCRYLFPMPVRWHYLASISQYLDYSNARYLQMHLFFILKSKQPLWPLLVSKTGILFVYFYMLCIYLCSFHF